MRSKRCYALLCAYDGGAFAGFQRQAPLLTVQGALEHALAELGISVRRIEGGGRTDRGVHACRQVVAFRTASSVDPDELPALLAERLPPSLVVLDAVEAPWSFHPRFSAVSKRYRYRVAALRDPSELERRFAWCLPDPRGFPDLGDELRFPAIDAMEEALAALRGPHDFRLLAHAKAEGKTRRVLSRAELSVSEMGERGRIYDFDFAASGFIRHQIRNMVGAVLSAGLGVIPPSEVRRLADAEGERWRGPRAPGWGLRLVQVGFRAGEDPFPRAA